MKHFVKTLLAKAPEQYYMIVKEMFRLIAWFESVE